MSVVTLDSTNKVLMAALTDQEYAVLNLAIQQNGVTFIQTALAYHIAQAQAAQIAQAKSAAVSFIASATPDQLAAITEAMNP